MSEGTVVAVHVWRPGAAVPEVLMGGDHAAIARFRAAEARRRQALQDATPLNQPAPNSTSARRTDSR